MMFPSFLSSAGKGCFLKPGCTHPPSLVWSCDVTFPETPGQHEGAFCPPEQILAPSPPALGDAVHKLAVPSPPYSVGF